MYKVNDDIHGCVDPDELLMVVDIALRKALQTDKKVGFCLSGGLDSTTLVKLAERMIDKVKTFSTVFPGTTSNEMEYIIAALDDGILSSIIVPEAPTLDDINRLVKIHGGPIPSLSLYVQYKLCERASQDVEVLIDGQGPDELLCGYIGYQATYIRELVARRYYWLAAKEAIYSMKNHWKVALKTLMVPVKETKQFDGKLCKILERDLTTSLAVELDWLKANANVFGLETRSPYTDPEVVRYCVSLPYDMKIRNGTSKWALRQATRGLIPESIRTRQTKLGFPAPEPEWMKGPMRSMVLDVMDSESYQTRGLWDARKLRRQFKLFTKGLGVYKRDFWYTVCTELWLCQVA